MKIIGGALGRDIHVAGLLNFLNIARDLGYEIHYLGPAVPVEKFVEEIKRVDPDIVAVSYRLSPESAEEHLTKFKEAIERLGLTKRKFVFGGTPATGKVAAKIGLFDRIFVGGESREAVVEFLSKHLPEKRFEKIVYPDNLVDRIRWRRPILRHHFGLPSLEETIKGAREIALAGVLDVISIAPDQDAQEFFFHPELQRPERKGDAGVPIRSPDDLRRIYEASRCGNYPLLRIYAGTNDLIRMAEMYVETIKNAWCAIPLMWYNVLDGRSQRPLEEAIRENQELMRWHAERNIPVEVNEPHHWSLRRAHDTIAVAMAYLSAYNAKKMGVRHYVAQYMFNTPGETSPLMDLAKMLAKVELVESLHDDSFTSFRQVRSGLLSFPTDLDLAKGQLAASVYLALNLDPDIVHVVGYCEGVYAATPKEIIESCKIVLQLIANYKMGVPDVTLDPRVQARKEELKREAMILVDGIRRLGKLMECEGDPLTNPKVLCRAVEIGLLDAPDLKGNPVARGELITQMIDGACYAIDPNTGEVWSEKERVEAILGDFYE